ncbi:MAG: hypothetical protein IPH97_17215 [Ignavibacteriales bacterium]|nr:hypothetical protein [Ignavibacteriales bacterium]
MKTKIAILFVVLTLSLINAQQIDEQKILTGSLSTDAKLVLDDFKPTNNPQMILANENKKSPMLAGLMSVLIPGTGEIYTEEYLKAGIFIAVEAAVITTAIIYDGKGDDKTTEFENYADDYTNPNHNWSVVKYAQWLNQYVITNEADKIIIDPNTELPPWKRVDWNQLNSVESGSHKLANHGEQQYYEMIGKYPQFSPGWNDFNSSDYHDISENFLFYSGMRGDANDFYSVAKTAVIGIYINHFLSSLDAIWSATNFNKDLAVKIRLDNIQFADHAEFYPKLYLTYNF